MTALIITSNFIILFMMYCKSVKDTGMVTNYICGWYEQCYNLSRLNVVYYVDQSWFTNVFIFNY